MKQIRNVLFRESGNLFCQECFEKSGKHYSGLPNVFRLPDSDHSEVEFFFIFDKPNDNSTYYQHNGCERVDCPPMPISILDPRAPFNNNPTRKNLCTLLDKLKEKFGAAYDNDLNRADRLACSRIHITNAVKCDRCAWTGSAGGTTIAIEQRDTCIKKFLNKEIKSLSPRKIVLFGSNADKYVTGRVGKMWQIRINVTICGHLFTGQVVRVPHTTSRSFFNPEQGAGGRNYIEKIKDPEFWRCPHDLGFP